MLGPTLKAVGFLQAYIFLSFKLRKFEKIEKRFDLGGIVFPSTLREQKTL